MSERPWDETVRVESVALNGAENKVVKGKELFGLATFHGDMPQPSKVPEVYNYIIEFLKK